MKLTAMAQDASDELGQASMYLLLSRDDLQKHDARLKSSHPQMEAPNAKYNAMAERFIAEWGICKAADTYQWYNRKVLHAAACRSPSILKNFPGKMVAARAIDRVAGLISERELKDWAVRKHLHEHLGIWEESEMALIVRARNCIVHAMGLDSGGEMAKAIAEAKSAWGLIISVRNGRLRVTAAAAETALHLTLAQISLMDQGFARLHHVPVSERKPPRFTRIMG